MAVIGGGFEADLFAWITRVYEHRAVVAAQRVQQGVFQVLDREKRWLFPLTLGVVVGAAATPMFGPVALFVSLGLLYAGTIVSGVVTMRRAERIERALDARPAEERVDCHAAARRAWESRPPIGPEEGARLVRMMNLSRLAAAPAAWSLLAAEVSEALEVEPLARWTFLSDLADLVHIQSTPAGAR